jgi:hypothetical protein
LPVNPQYILTRKLKKKTKAVTKWINLTVPNQKLKYASVPLMKAGGLPMI